MKPLVIWTILIGIFSLILNIDPHPHAGYLAQIGLLFIWLTGVAIYLLFWILRAANKKDESSQKTVTRGK